MRVEPTGVVFIGECEVQSPRCVALTPEPITAIWTSPARRQVNVCRACLDEMVRSGQWEVASARLQRRYDVAVLDARHQPVLVVEVKLRQMADAPLAAWARAVRRNLIAHAGAPSAPFFMLVLVPSHAFLWVRGRSGEPDLDPDYVIDTERDLAPLLSAQARVDQPAWQRAEAAVAGWLSDVLRHGPVADWYRHSGLAEATRGGEVVTESLV
ncbi:MAG: hypothetical protein HYU66_14460 [Armatimonadetes bacterium]|nr:hypothetical protein [Armatimonadota bacterium]